MHVQVLVVPDCPTTATAVGLVSGVLDEFGWADVPVRVRVISGQAEAERSGFTGSPTILIDGLDPFAGSHRTPGLACRLYPNSAGLAGLPDAAALRESLRAAGRSGRSKPRGT